MTTDLNDDDNASSRATGRAGRPPHVPNEQLRSIVKRLAAQGNEWDAIAEAIGLSEPTLRKYYTMDVRAGLRLGKVRNTQRLHQAAEKGNVTAMIWLDKTRYGVAEPIEQPKKVLIAEQAQTAQDGSRWEGLLQ